MQFAVEYMKPIWNNLAALHLNTVIGTVSWELTEPVEGRFDFSLARISHELVDV
jgi:beta-galactosidase GanA